MAAVKEFFTKSVLESSQTNLNWEIVNFDKICPNPKLKSILDEEKQAFFKRQEANLVSATFEPVLECFVNGTMQNKLRAKMCLTLGFTITHQNHDVNSKENSISIYLKTTEVQNISDDVYILFKISILGLNDQVLLTRNARFTNSMLKGLMYWGWRHYITVQKLWDENYLIDGKLHVKVTVDCIGSPVTTLCPMFQDLNSDSESLARAREFSSDFLHSLETGMDSDVQVNVKGRVFNLHTFVLKSRSRVFRTMLQAPLLEAQTKRIEIPDIDPSHFEHFVKFIYGGKTKDLRYLNVSALLGLVSLGDKYEIDSLKSYCLARLANLVSTQNVAEIAVSAYRHNADRDVRNHILSFCTENWSTLSKNTDFRNAVEQEPGAFLSN